MGDLEPVNEQLRIQNAQKRGPRMSVSAEVFGNYNKQEDYQAPVYAKTPEQIAAITKRMEKNFFFDSLNPTDKNSILQAIVPKQYKPGETVIQ